MQVIYWTKKIFSVQEDEEVFTLKKQITEAVNSIPSQKQQGIVPCNCYSILKLLIEMFDKEVAELQLAIRNVENKLHGSVQTVKIQINSKYLRVL